MVDNILDTVKMVHERGFWEEIVTLVIPGFNDSEDELQRAADFIASVSPDIPWHVTAFHQDYHMKENANTTAEQLIARARLDARPGCVTSMREICRAESVVGKTLTVRPAMSCWSSVMAT